MIFTATFYVQVQGETGHSIEAICFKSRSSLLVTRKLIQTGRTTKSGREVGGGCVNKDRPFNPVDGPCIDQKVRSLAVQLPLAPRETSNPINQVDRPYNCLKATNPTPRPLDRKSSRNSNCYHRSSRRTQTPKKGNTWPSF